LDNLCELLLVDTQMLYHGLSPCLNKLLETFLSLLNALSVNLFIISSDRTDSLLKKLLPGWLELLVTVKMDGVAKVERALNTGSVGFIQLKFG